MDTDRAARRYLEAALNEVGLRCKEAEVAALLEYGAMLLEARKRVNLTGARTWEELVDGHIIDCVAVVRKVDWSGVGLVFDVGSGAGLPGIPVAIMRPEIEVGLIEARKKKGEFLRDCVTRLGLKKVTVYLERAEVLGRRGAWRERAERVVARGVAPLAVLLEYCLPLVALGGRLIAWKGPGVGEEIEAAARALSELGGWVAGVWGYRLRDGRERFVVEVEKVALTPERYPRRPGIARKRPL